MKKITGFADEISPDLKEQIEVLTDESIKYLELRSVWGKNVLKLSDNELLEVKGELERHQIGVSAIGSPIGKIGILDDFEDHLLDLDRAIFVAKLFSTEYIRIFSFLLPPGDNHYTHRDEVMRRMKSLVKRAEEADIILLHENESGMFGDVDEHCFDVLNTCSSANLRQAFDPGNLVQCGVKSIMKSYHLLQPYIEYIHIKDATIHNGREVPAGKGDGQLLEILQHLKDTGYDGFLSLEPHLVHSGLYTDKTATELFKVASHALKDLLNRLK